jgi:hypothetical protein
MGGSPFLLSHLLGGAPAPGIGGEPVVVGCLAGPGLAQGVPDDLPQLGDPRGSRAGHRQGRVRAGAAAR